MGLPSNQPGDSLFIFHAKELEMKDDGPCEQPARLRLSQLLESV
jgi:hypothetical protein